VASNKMIKYVKLPPDVHKELKKICVELDMYMMDFATIAIRKLIEDVKEMLKYMDPKEVKEKLNSYGGGILERGL